jgi:outer membrane protein assembly factor BamB
MKTTTLLLAHRLAGSASLWTALALLATLALGLRPAQAAVTEAWVQRYNGPANSNDFASAVAVDSSGNVVVTGSSYNQTNSDYYTAKYAAANGALLWERRYSGPANRDDFARSVIVDGSGNVVVTGTSYNGTNDDYYTAKYAAADGALLWEKRYHGPTNCCAASAVAVDASGNVVVTSIFEDFSVSDYAFSYTAKYAAADGAPLWEKYHISGGGEAVVVDGNGNVVVSGFYGTIKILADGTEVRIDPGGYGGALAVDSTGNVVVMNIYGSTAKYAAADGALLWWKPSFFSNAVGYAKGAVDGSGNVVVTGFFYHGFLTDGDSYTAKYAAADGALLWERRYNGPANSNELANAVAVDGSGNVVVTGTSYNSTNSDYFTAKFAAADGALLWEKRYNGPANGYAGASSLALGPNGMVAVTGSSSGDFATVVYRDDVDPISIALVPTGVRLRFTGIPGRSYTIERAPSVTGPWTTLNTQIAPASGLLEFLDTALPPGSAFYRTVQP